LALFAYIITAFIAHPPLLSMLRATVTPSIQLNKAFLGIVVAILGTTISPYLFFWQASSEVEEMKAAGATTEKERQGVTRKELKAARTDVAIWDALQPTSDVRDHPHLGIGDPRRRRHQRAIRSTGCRGIASGGWTVRLHPLLSRHDRDRLARHPRAHWGRRLRRQRVPRNPGSLADRPLYRPTFYGIICLAMLGGLLMNFLGIDPIKALVVTANINGMVAPPILVLIALLARDRKVMGEQRSGAGALPSCGRPRS
jgi:hypothetical protein